jgi:hypothetical protein
MCSPGWETNGWGRNPKVNSRRFDLGRARLPGSASGLSAAQQGGGGGGAQAGARAWRAQAASLFIGAHTGQLEAAAAMAALADGPWRARRPGWRGRERVGSGRRLGPIQ